MNKLLLHCFINSVYAMLKKLREHLIITMQHEINYTSAHFGSTSDWETVSPALVEMGVTTGDRETKARQPLKREWLCIL